MLARFQNTLKYEGEREPAPHEKLLSEAETFSIGEICVSCLYTPGHSVDHISYVVTHVTPDSTKVPLLFSGASLEIGGVGPCGDRTVLSSYRDSVSKMMYLPGETLLFPSRESAIANL